MSPTNESEVYKVAMSSLEANKSAGFDNVKPKIVRKVMPFIVKPLRISSIYPC